MTGMLKTRLVQFLTIFITLSFLAPVGVASAHSPVFSGENNSPNTAYQIDDPSKSWAIYDELGRPDKGKYYKFSIARGDKIQLALLTPKSPAESGFLPSFALLIPEMTQDDSVPDYVDVPKGYSTIVVDGFDPGTADYEAFSPGWYYEVAKMTINAPADGIYYVVVFNSIQTEDIHNHDDENHDHDQEALKYGLVIGYIESFTPIELILVPYNIHKIYVWEGQNQFMVILPIVLVLVVGGIIFYWRSRKDMPPKGASKWFALFAGLSFIGSAVSILYQMFLAFSVTGFHGEGILTLIFVILSTILGVVTLLYAVRDKPILTTWRRIGLIITGFIALFVWSGLYLGTVLVFMAAILPPYTIREKH